MVGLEPLAEAEDLELVRDLLIQHAGYTGSTVAARLLSDWDSAVDRFVKVMPLDYRRVLEERKRLEDEAREAMEQEQQQVEVARG
jgi:glutamate synthase domain-containing protein 3